MARVKRQPTDDEQRELNAVIENEATEVKVRNKTYKVKGLHKETMRKMTDVMLNCNEESQVSSKCAALIILNGFFKIKLFYWFLWRWVHYVMQYSDEELATLIEEGKKKVPVQAYYQNTILLIGMKDTMVAMTRKEAERIRQELLSGQPTR